MLSEAEAPVQRVARGGYYEYQASLGYRVKLSQNKTIFLPFPEFL